MSLLTEKKFSFVSRALPEDTFSVIHFTGYEGLSRLYEFDISLVSENPDIDLDQILAKPAQLVIHRGDGDDVFYNGVLQQFEQQQEVQGYVFYRAVLSPRLWWLTFTRHNQVCLDESVRTFVENTLRDGGLTANDYEFRLRGSYPKIDYVCQYGESHFNFVSRWLEREGIYYYFEQGRDAEKLIITDEQSFHGTLPRERDLFYSPPSGLDSSRRDEAVQSLFCRQRPLPRKVVLRDYNLERPSLEVTGEAEVDPLGRGEIYLYGESFATPEEGDRLAAIRAEEILCRRQELYGESTVPFMLPGFLFTLRDHYRESFNRDYLIVEVTHEGNQTGYLISGLAEALAGRDRSVFYRNSFKAIPEGVQYRPERKTEKPRIAGTMHARVDAEGDGTRAEMDSQGRYRVRLPFDINDGHGAGRASSFIRMAEPYSGTGRGMHFPLLKGTEVLLTFIDGDPDRPFISGTVPSPEAPSVVNSACNTSGGINDGSNAFIMHNSPEAQRITMTAGPEENSAFFSMGAGSPSAVISQAMYKLHDTLYSVQSKVTSTDLGAVSQSMTTNSILWGLSTPLIKLLKDAILEHDAIGLNGAIEKAMSYKGCEQAALALGAAAPVILTLILSAQMARSLVAHLAITAPASAMAGFGPETIKNQIEMETLYGWKVRCAERLKAPTWKNYLPGNGWSGSYGVLIMNNSGGGYTDYLNPASGTTVSIKQKGSDVLIASGQGYIDIDAAESVSLNGSNIVLEGDKIYLDSAKKVAIGAGNVGKSSITILQESPLTSQINLESGQAAILICGMAEPKALPTIQIAAGLQAIVLDLMSITIGNGQTSGLITIDASGIKLDSLTGLTASSKTSLKVSTLGTANISSAMGMTINSEAGDTNINGKVGVKVGGAFTPQVKVMGSNLNVEGDMITIKGTGIVKTQGAMIQIG